ncbi:hypothetical protein [Streptomyces sp. NEAU-174]|uniref:hypothetical protein n=1 Tax=Streptomyces sp. NEAU-174 TaxID=3458254 RepID=UPI0040450771
MQHVIGDDRRPAAMLATAGRGVEAFELRLGDVSRHGLRPDGVGRVVLADGHFGIVTRLERTPVMI